MRPPFPTTRLLRTSGRPASGAGGFTTIELMFAIAIGALLMLTAIPAVRGLQKPPLVRGVNDFVEACRQARAQAILGNRAMQVVIHNGGSDLGVEPAPLTDPSAMAFAPATSASGEPAVAFLGDLGSGNSVPAAGSAKGTSAGLAMKPFSAAFADGVAFEQLLVNRRNQMQEETAQIRFYPNGTCDELDAVLAFERRDAQRISLEVLTGQATVTTAR